jgi:uncharacterized membrane protein
MQSKRALMTAAVSGLLAVGLTTMSVTAAAADMETEKCFGVAKAGKNDCAANGHACSGQAKTDADPGEWISLPKGTCERLLNGRAVAEKA